MVTMSSDLQEYTLEASIYGGFHWNGEKLLIFGGFSCQWRKTLKISLAKNENLKMRGRTK